LEVQEVKLGTLILISMAAASLSSLLGAHEREDGHASTTNGRLESTAERAENPSVAPGLVSWHANRQAASAASARSGRPVLVFQLLGRLDEELC